MRYHLDFTAWAHFFFEDSFYSMTYSQPAPCSSECWCGCFVDHFDRAMEQQSHKTHTSFLKLDCVSLACGVSGCQQFVIFAIQCIQFTNYPMNFFSMFFAVCVGQATNPGPDTQAVTFAIANPTALHKKTSRLLNFDADVIITSETSATNVIQKEVTTEMRIHHFRSFWSPPVAPKKQTVDSRPSYRGEALGTAIFSRLPSRSTRIQVPAVLEQSQRFTSCVVRLGSQEILVVAIYGFATRYMEGKRPNDLLLACIASFVETVGLPFLICGDFNEPPLKLASFQYFRDLGATEAFQWYENRFHQKLPPTCAGSTRNDTAIIHPSLIPLIVNMSVQSQHQFDIHTPLFIEFNVGYMEQQMNTWQLPKNWAGFHRTTTECYSRIL